MLRKTYELLLLMFSILLSSTSAAALARLADVPPAALVVPGVIFAFTLLRRPGGELVREQIGSAVLFSVTAGASVWLGSQMSPHPVIGAVVFVALMTASVWTRRFGPTATRLGAMVPPALLAALFTTGGAEQGPWWPGCGWAALVGLLAFCWVHVLRRAGRRLLHLPRPAPRAAAARRRRARRGPSVSTRMAAQTGLSLAVAFTAGHLLFGEHWQWTVLSALVVNLGTIGRGDLTLKGLERGAGAVLGTLFATGLTVLLHPHGSASVVLICVALAAAMLVRQNSYAGYAACVTTTMSLLYGHFGESAEQLLLIRLQALMVGAVLAVAVGWLLLPVRAGDVVRGRMAAALAGLAAVLDAHREGSDTVVPLRGFEAAVREVHRSARSLWLHRRVLHLMDRRRATPHRTAPVEALVNCLEPLRALTAAPGSLPGEAATAANVAVIRRRLAAPEGPLPNLPPPSPEPPLAALDAALERLAEDLPALR
ncbi:FUSC family protein [Streptomyces nodosus]|uniref:FUSC family protein n=1 Tax=Streptomyces nodosus TaxID=40318 RepID=UPI00345204E6